jgi:CheY-like chemotaxis protein
VNRYIRKDGTCVDVLWSASWSSSEKKMFCVAHDITERARIEKALRDAKEEADRANHAKSEFLSRMSHELRTPLNAILGFGQLLERQNPTDVQRTRVGHIVSAGRHLLNLINEVLDISRIEAGNMQLSVEPVSLGDALEETLSLMRPLAAERNIDISTPAAPDIEFYVSADRQRLKQILLNLLSNAIKYTPIGGRVTISATSSDTGTMRIVVTDSGAGIPAAKLARLFTPFDRLGAEQSTVEGTGLGLALCQRLVSAMHGSIGVNSSVGRGSTFWIELPIAESPMVRLAAVSRNGAKVHDPAVTRRTVLYIEDNTSNLRLVEQMLKERPEVELISAMKGGEGLDLAREHSPDLILLDLHLPDIPGWEVLSRLKADPATADIRVVVVSADATEHQRKRLLAAGASSYLTKPIDLEEFFGVVDDIAFEPRIPECAFA